MCSVCSFFFLRGVPLTSRGGNFPFVLFCPLGNTGHCFFPERGPTHTDKWSPSSRTFFSFQLQKSPSFPCGLHRGPLSATWCRPPPPPFPLRAPPLHREACRFNFLLFSGSQWFKRCKPYFFTVTLWNPLLFIPTCFRSSENRAAPALFMLVLEDTTPVVVCVCLFLLFHFSLGWVFLLCLCL